MLFTVIKKGGYHLKMGYLWWASVRFETTNPKAKQPADAGAIAAQRPTPQPTVVKVRLVTDWTKLASNRSP